MSRTRSASRLASNAGSPGSRAPRPRRSGQPHTRAWSIAVGGLLASALALVAGCHSRYVQTTIDNQGPAAVRLIEVDYPSASFGVEEIAANSRFHYRFKIQGSGPLKLEFTDRLGKVHDVNGPDLHQGQEGRLGITIDPDGNVTWRPSLSGLQ